MTPMKTTVIPIRVRPMLAILAATLVIPSAWADTITVAPSGGDYTTIQAAVDAANPLGGDTIQVAAGTYTENVYIDIPVSIVGAGPGSTIVDGGGAGSVFDVYSEQLVVPVDISLVGMTIRSGSSGSGGGGVFVNGLLADDLLVTLDTCVVSGNAATGASHGGGIHSYYAGVRILNSTISGNSTFTAPTSSTRLGGGIYAQGGNLTVTNSTISGNTAGKGGGLYLLSSPVAEITHATFSANTATGTGNTGGGVSVNASSLTLTNSIVAGNTATTNPNISGSLLPASSTNITSGDPKLAALADNGGPTPTHALLTGRPALNAGTGSTTGDQRGVTRPQGSAPDIGAYENAAPVIAQGASVAATMDEDGSPASWTTPAITAADSDTGSTLTWTKESGPSHGTATVSGTGAAPTVVYSPAADWNGSDSFVMKVSTTLPNFRVVGILLFALMT